MKRILVVLVLVAMFLPTFAQAGNNRGVKHTVLRWSNTPGSYCDIDLSEAQTIGNSTDIPINYEGDPGMIQALVLRILDVFQKQHQDLKIIGKQEIYIFPHNTSDSPMHVFSVRIDHEPKKK